MGWHVRLKRFDLILCRPLHFELSTVMGITRQYFLS